MPLRCPHCHQGDCFGLLDSNPNKVLCRIIARNNASNEYVMFSNVLDKDAFIQFSKDLTDFYFSDNIFYPSRVPEREKSILRFLNNKYFKTIGVYNLIPYDTESLLCPNCGSDFTVTEAKKAFDNISLSEYQYTCMRCGEEVIETNDIYVCQNCNLTGDKIKMTGRKE